MRIPSASDLRLHMRKTRARRRIRNPDQDMTARAFDLPPRIARIALQRLIAVGTIEFEIRVAHIVSIHA